ncbi:MAG: fused response regulator/phosphatase [Pseudomonadota bacterium]
MNPTVSPPKTSNRLALIADDELSNRIILKALIKKMGYEVIQAENGAQAVELFKTHHPDLVLMDVMMPILDGYEATTQIKQLAGAQFIPVMFLTAMTDEASLARCIEVGGDDFITKPYSHTLLAAKVRSMERIHGLHKDIHSLISRMQRDEEIAEQVFSGAVVAGNVALDQIRSLLKPASVFSGDLMLTAFSPSRDLHVMLGDFTGHGLASALGALPTSEVFRTMTAKGFSPQQILGAINNKLHHLLPTGMFLGVQFLRVSHKLDHIFAFNCGMPDCFVLDGETREIKHTILSNSLPLGITTDFNLDDCVQHIRVDQNDRVILATDGVTEARNLEGEYFGIDRFKQSIKASAGLEYVLDGVETALLEYCQEAEQDDDISLVEIPLIEKLLPDWDTEKVHKRVKHVHLESDFDMESDSVEFQVTLRGSQLRKADPVPMLINTLQETAGLKEHQRPLFTILTELFANALDHGVLNLDSKLKEGVDGFTRYFEERDRLLNKQLDGHIRIGMRVHPLENGGLVLIQIEDSGAGFDFKNRNPGPTDEQMFSGRGIMLVESLCESFRYIDPGNKAEALYSWIDH